MRADLCTSAPQAVGCPWREKHTYISFKYRPEPEHITSKSAGVKPGLAWVKSCFSPLAVARNAADGDWYVSGTATDCLICRVSARNPAGVSPLHVPWASHSWSARLSLGYRPGNWAFTLAGRESLAQLAHLVEPDIPG